jgi:hypothetical protein
MAQPRQHHQPRPPARRRRQREAAAEAIGRSRGGLSTQVHLVVDALGLPLTFEITQGQRDDSKPANELVARVLSQCLLADKAYDSDDFRAALDQQRCVPAHPLQRQSLAEACLRQGPGQGSLRDRAHVATCSSRPAGSRRATRKHRATTRLWSPSAARYSGCASEATLRKPGPTG